MLLSWLLHCVKHVLHVAGTCSDALNANLGSAYPAGCYCLMLYEQKHAGVTGIAAVRTVGLVD